MADRQDFLVVGLGNPGEEYEFTPHNLGFLAIDRLAERNAIRVTRKECDARVGNGVIHSKRVALAKPQTFMNESGRAVKGLLGRYEVEPDRLPESLVVVYDELDLPWGTLRIKPKGSAAGHNGMKSVIAHLGTQNFVRVRVGVDRGREGGRGAGFLLSRLSRSQKQEMEEMAARAAEAVESILAEGVEKSMAIYNRRAQGLQEEEE
ncbi:MAG TPA: aminoacyl-tRNA hydrolase [Bryobacteraceae bacterium]|jgi:PTH1 family peptidyl-tRNA hydrolase